jgi:hypothetical protein
MFMYFEKKLLAYLLKNKRKTKCKINKRRENLKINKKTKK